ncbi:MAG: hypothetical protein GWP03_06755 [Proteobacteria bacterium]|nr:hypothetical protein [Pseudomonadota bacterium]
MKNFILAMLLFIPMSMFADVETHETFNNNFGFVGTKGTRTIYIKGNLERVDEATEMTGKFAMMMSQGKTKRKSIQITDLGKKLIYSIDPDKSVYSKIDIKDIEMTDSTYDMDSLKDNFEYEIKDMKESKVINGFSAKHYIATMRIIGDDKTDTLKIIDDMWVSKNVPEWKTINNYNRLLKTSFSKNSKGKGLKYMKDFYKKIAEIEGYPVKSDISMFTSASDDNKEDNSQGMQSLMGGQGDGNKSENGMRMFHSLTEVKSINKKSLNSNLFKLKSEWKEIGN